MVVLDAIRQSDKEKRVVFLNKEGGGVL